MLETIFMWIALISLFIAFVFDDKKLGALAMLIGVPTMIIWLMLIPLCSWMWENPKITNEIGYYNKKTTEYRWAPSRNKTEWIKMKEPR